LKEQKEIKRRAKIIEEFSSIMLALIRPILFSFLTSRKVKQLIVDMLEALAKNTENSLDDLAVQTVKNALLPAKK
jgi:hypothetical protein